MGSVLIYPGTGNRYGGIVKTVTISVNTDTLNITTDDDGNALNLTDFDIYFNGQSYETKNNAELRLNANSGNIYRNLNVDVGLQGYIYLYALGYVDKYFSGEIKFRKMANNYTVVQTFRRYNTVNFLTEVLSTTHIVNLSATVSQINLSVARWSPGTEIIVKRM